MGRVGQNQPRMIAAPARLLRSLWRDGLLLAAVVAAPLIGGRVGTPGPAAVTLKLGPNTGTYLSGFAPRYEIENLLATRWTTYHARVALPLEFRGPAELSFRFARVFSETADVQIRVAGRPVDSFSCRGGIYAVRRVDLGRLSRTSAEVAFDVDSHERRDRGLRLDWVRLSVGAGGRITPRGAAFWLPALLAAALYLLFRRVGHSPALALLLTLPWLVTAIAWPARDPLGFAHVTLKIVPVALGLAAAAALACARMRGGRWLLAIFVMAYLLKGAGLFHPTTFYPDFQNARRYVEALREAPGSLAERTVEAQKRENVAYPRIIAGKAYAFPYSPLFFLPFGLFGGADAIEDAYHHAALLFATGEILLVFFLARILVRRMDSPDPASDEDAARVAVIAALLASFLPPAFSRMLLAMTVTLAGHLLDCALIAAAALFVLRPERRGRLAAVALTALASLLTYVSSLFTVTAFLGMLALLERRHAVRLLAVLAGALGATVAWLYWPFVRAFVSEILPAVLAGNTLAPARPGAAVAGPWEPLRRIPLFYGYAYPLFALAGLGLAHRQIDRRLFRVVAAFGLAFLALVTLRAFGGGLFRDLKEISFVGPLIALLSAIFVARLARTGRWGAAAAVLVIVGLAVFGLAQYRSYLETYASPFLRVIE
jgi:hypothetical protein